MRDGSTLSDGRNTSISVVITTYNDGELLAESIGSVVMQLLRPTEILVVDDGSYFRTAPTIIRRIQSVTDLEIQYHWKENSGPSGARNFGLQLATGEWIAYLDADDRWLPHHLAAKAVRAQALSPQYSTVYDGFVEFDGNTGANLPTIPIASFDGPIIEASLGLPHGVPAGMQFQMHRASALRDVGGFDPELQVNEDFDILLRLGELGYRIAGSSEVTVERRVHPNSLTQSDAERTHRGLEKFLQKVEALGLLGPQAVASRRKWARLGLAKALLRNPDESAGKVLVELRKAFEHSQPSDLQQWGLKVLASAPPLGIPAVWAARLLRRIRI